MSLIFETRLTTKTAELDVCIEMSKSKLNEAAARFGLATSFSELIEASEENHGWPAGILILSRGRKVEIGNATKRCLSQVTSQEPEFSDGNADSNERTVQYQGSTLAYSYQTSEIASPPDAVREVEMTESLPVDDEPDAFIAIRFGKAYSEENPIELFLNTDGTLQKLSPALAGLLDQKRANVNRELSVIILADSLSQGASINIEKLNQTLETAFWKGESLDAKLLLECLDEK